MRYNVIAQFEGGSSFGYVAEQVVRALVEKGHDVVAVAADLPEHMEKVQPVAGVVKQRMGVAQQKATSVVILPLAWPGMEQIVGGCDYWYTLWESTKLEAKQVRTLNSVGTVLTSTKWGKQVMKNNKVTRPISLLPLGVDTDVFGLGDVLPQSATFMTAGRGGSGPYRKGLERVVAAFLLHASRCSTSRLLVKAAPQDGFEFSHPRIQIVAQHLPARALASMYASSLCYVSGACGEGWGLHQHEALCCGRPVIAACWGGVTEFFKGELHGYPIRYRMQKAKDWYHHTGQWAEPSVNAMAEAMDRVVANPMDALVRGLRGHLDCNYLSLSAMRKRTLEVLK